MSKLEQRLEELEIKFSYQQETVDSLNETVTKQWEEIDALKKLSGLLREEVLTLKENAPTTPADKEPLPPHY